MDIFVSVIDPDMLERKLAAGYRPSNPTHAPEHIFPIMQKCWEENPDDRPSFSDFMQHCDNFYNLSDNYSKEQNKNGKAATNTVGLKYVQLALHERRLEDQFNSIRLGNLR